MNIPQNFGSLAVISALVCSAGTTQAAQQRSNLVSIGLHGEEFGNGEVINVLNNKKRIHASSSYRYELAGSIRGTGPLADLLPEPVSLENFLNSISPGSAGFLSGTIENPGGDLPFTIKKRTVKGSKFVPGLGKVNVEFKFRLNINPNGLVHIVVNQVSVRTPDGPVEGTLKLVNTRLTVQAAPSIKPAKGKISVAEDAGSASITISRARNLHGEVTVDFRTIDGTAVAGTDYESTNGTLVFGPSESTKTITIPIIDNNVVNPTKRKFSIRLGNPSDNAELGSRRSTTVLILDDES